MSNNTLHSLHDSSAPWPHLKSLVRRRAFSLTRSDRTSLERLLQDRVMFETPYPIILTGFLRHKLRTAIPVREPAPVDLVTGGCHLYYMISGGGLQSGVLTFNALHQVGAILVASMLGATMIGMRRRQRAPMLREDGTVETLVILDTSPLPELAAA